MSRLTSGPQEIEYLKNTQQRLRDVASQNQWRVKIITHNGVEIEGHFCETSDGSRVDGSGNFSYHGSVTIINRNGNAHTIDRLDINSIESP
ncbi:MAG: hypothetical protein OEU26_05750 [Candidatus Tectomicrobia bacterium]|nr:hypothetical protein [Candidatus Tectomicrobia bacterium]